MIDITKPAISMIIRYEDSEYSFAAAPYAAACLDIQGKLVEDRYFVFYANTHSPDNEVRFIRKDDGSECLKIDLAKLSSAVDQILILVIGLDWYPSNLICEALDDQGGIVSRIVVNSKKIKDIKAFAVAKLFGGKPWKLEMKKKTLTDAELKKIIE